MLRTPVADIRQPLLELCTYIPYFEERVGGTFRFQYRDEETGELKDMEGYEESNQYAMFPDPVSDDEIWRAFRELFFHQIYDPKTGDRNRPEDRLIRLLRDLAYAIVHERLCTGYTAMCMKDGTYLNLLMQIKEVLP